MIPKKVFIDSAFFKAVIDQNDDFHEIAMKQLLSFRDNKTELLTTNFILDESYTLIRIKSSFEKAILFRKFLSEGVDYFRVEGVTFSDEINAWEWFLNEWKHLSFTDCTSFAVMKRLGLTDVATFDQHFTKAGFKIFK